MCGCFVFMYICEPCACSAMLVEARRGHCIPLNWSYKQSSATVQLLGNKPGSKVAISPASCMIFFRMPKQLSCLSLKASILYHIRFKKSTKRNANFNDYETPFHPSLTGTITKTNVDNCWQKM